MRLVSFNPLRSLGIPGVQYIKPEQMYRQKEAILAADWVIFPEYWQVNVLVYAWKKRIFPNINTYHLGHDKVEETRAFWAICPENMPYTRILPGTTSSIEQVFNEFPFPFVVKEIRNSMGLGVFLVKSRQDFFDYAKHNSIFYIQEFLPIKRDLRIVYLGERVIAAYWRNGAEGAFHNNVARGGNISYNDIPRGAIDLVESVAQKLGINHAGFDVVDLDGHYYFLEFNTMFGNQAMLDLKISLGELIYEYLLSQSEDDPKGGTPRTSPYLKNVG